MVGWRLYRMSKEIQKMELENHVLFCEYTTKYIRDCLDNRVSEADILKSFGFMIKSELINRGKLK